MPPDAAILYPRKTPQADSDSPKYFGVTRITESGTFWISAWERIVNGKVVLELKLNRKDSK
jgi:hypothetical protein